VDPVLQQGTPVYQYEPQTWGPKEVEASITPPGGWQNPITTDQEDFRAAGSAGC